MSDFNAAGGAICEGSLGQQFLYPGLFPSAPCNVDNSGIVDGICSVATEQELVKDECFYEIIKQPSYIYNSFIQFIRDTCTEPVYEVWRNNFGNKIGQPVAFQIRPPRRNKKRKKNKRWNKKKKERLSPITNIFDIENGPVLNTELKFENTKHR